MPQKRRGRPAVKKPQPLIEVFEDTEPVEEIKPAKPARKPGKSEMRYKCEGILANHYNAIKVEVAGAVSLQDMESVAGVYPLQLTIELNRTLKNSMGSQSKMQYLLAKQGTNILPIEYV